VFLSPDQVRRLCLARELLGETPETPRSIAQIARSVGISHFHFIRQFEAVFGTTPHQFRIARRIDRATRLLALDAGSVTDVCLEVGFSSLGSFSTLFARRLGESPSRYRARARRLVQVQALSRFDPTLGCLSLMTRLPWPAFSQFSRRRA
jgi:AraC-type DNA-binding domain-containing proteins